MDAHVLLSPVGQKTETRFNCLLTENRKSTEMMGTPSTVRKLLPPLRRSPSLKEGGLGAARALSNFLLLLRVQSRNPGRFNGGYGVPRGFKGGSKPSAPCGRLSEAEHPKRKRATLLRPLSAVNRNLPGNSHSRASAPCDFRFPPCFFPHSGRMASIPPIPSGASCIVRRRCFPFLLHSKRKLFGRAMRTLTCFLRI